MREKRGGVLKHIELLPPEDIERKSFEMIESEMTEAIDDEKKPVVKRIIHATADFSYEKSLKFSDKAIENGIDAIKSGCSIITDTNMAKAGINKKAAGAFGCEIFCFMADNDVAEKAAKNKTTRALVSMDKSLEVCGEKIYAIGNAPTALIRLCELIKCKKVKPALVIGMPVGFVNVVESKRLIMELDVPFIVAEGRKGGSAVAAAAVNSLLYMAMERQC
ncbi:MAG: precorrin-8X methylmutase [Firmicutes bacterium]|nr:precorrin-8X methylmutase [Bacillota bacterium]